jgi:hypothetical protein
MGTAVSERSLDALPKTELLHFGLHQEQQIHEVLHARVVAIDTGARVSVELFRELLLARDHAEGWPRQTGEIKPPLALDLIGRFDQVITDPNIHMKADEWAASHPGLNWKSATSLWCGIEVQNGLTDLEDEPVGQIE